MCRSIPALSLGGNKTGRKDLDIARSNSIKLIIDKATRESRRRSDSERSVFSSSSDYSVCAFCIHLIIKSHIIIALTSREKPTVRQVSHPSARKECLLAQDLLGDANDTASRAGASVASLLALLVAAFAKVVSAGVDDDGAAEDALGADQLDVLVGDGALGVALAVGLEVAEVTNVALAVGGGAVGLVVRVDWRVRESAA